MTLNIKSKILYFYDLYLFTDFRGPYIYIIRTKILFRYFLTI